MVTETPKTTAPNPYIPAQNYDDGVNAAAPTENLTAVVEIEFTPETNSSSGVGKSGSSPAGGTLPDALAIDKPDSTATNINNLTEQQMVFDLAVVFALFYKLANTMREMKRSERTEDMKSQLSNLLSAADKMVDAAYERFGASIIQGAMQLAGGLIQAGASSLSFKQTIQGAELKAQAGTNEGLLMQSKMWDAAGQQSYAFGKAGSDISGGLGTIASSGLTLLAALDDADVARFQAMAKKDENSASEAADIMGKLKEILDDIRQKLSSMNDSSIESNRKMLN